jgi:predicted nucleic acid-binding protein
VRFVDTNILLYAISRDPAEQDKAKRANDILTERDLALSVQVLQEFYVQATRASRADAISHQQAVLLIESFRRFPVQDITSGIMMAALDTRQRFQLSYWDAAIIEASRAMGCTQVLSEDLSDGQDYGGVRVANPFRSETEQPVSLSLARRAVFTRTFRPACGFRCGLACLDSQLMNVKLPRFGL